MWRAHLQRQLQLQMISSIWTTHHNLMRVWIPFAYKLTSLWSTELCIATKMFLQRLVQEYYLCIVTPGTLHYGVYLSLSLPSILLINTLDNTYPMGKRSNFNMFHAA